MTRSIIFDVDGVLVHGYHARPDGKTWEGKFLIDLGIDPVRFRDEFIYDIFIKKVVVGQTALVDALDRRLSSFGYKGSAIAFAQHWAARNSFPNEELLADIRRLKARSDIKLYLATNQDHMRAQWLWQTLGLGELFDDMFYSARARAMKPMAAFFEFAAARMGPQTEIPLFFDDTQKVVEGACNFGWESVLFTSNNDFRLHPWIKDRL
ncbi:HAD-IA family hydrolase [Devosia sp. Leaf64]|uniref:HAD family hydrolase n=1 Tax=Devosia sp. Leaf64 TaxID=1736229 RepID=UPI00071351B4|nr:HAD-IA family hydrolase [Devosia sp. Leaf64]KQN74229.1 hypothetical protein ASE94_04300 [Devosia sp. Leaf64]